MYENERCQGKVKPGKPDDKTWASVGKFQDGAAKPTMNLALLIINNGVGTRVERMCLPAMHAAEHCRKKELGFCASLRCQCPAFST